MARVRLSSIWTEDSQSVQDSHCWQSLWLYSVYAYRTRERERERECAFTRLHRGVDLARTDWLTDSPLTVWLTVSKPRSVTEVGVVCRYTVSAAAAYSCVLNNNNMLLLTVTIYWPTLHVLIRQLLILAVSPQTYCIKLNQSPVINLLRSAANFCAALTVFGDWLTEKSAAPTKVICWAVQSSFLDNDIFRNIREIIIISMVVFDSKYSVYSNLLVYYSLLHNTV